MQKAHIVCWRTPGEKRVIESSNNVVAGVFYPNTVYENRKKQVCGFNKGLVWLQE